MKINSKARTLYNLKIKNAIVPKLEIFKSKNFLKSKIKIIKKIKEKFSKKVAIRSSSKNEDQVNKSNAGKFLSFLNVSANKDKELSDKILKVIKSYKKNINSSEFFVQEMVEKIKISGVVLTRELENYLPCYNINYYIGNDSSAVTSGKRGSKNLVYIDNKKYKIKKQFQKLISVVKEIQKKTGHNDLDIEFAIDKLQKIYILQVRQLVIKKKKKY